MKRNSVFTIIGIIVTLAAAAAAVVYFLRKNHVICGEDYEDDLLEYIDGEDCHCGADDEPAHPEAPAPEEAPAE